MKNGSTIAAALFLSALTLTLSGCEEEGAFEEAGEQMDEAAENTGDAIEDATDGN